MKTLFFIFFVFYATTCLAQNYIVEIDEDTGCYISGYETDDITKVIKEEGVVKRAVSKEDFEWIVENTKGSSAANNPRPIDLPSIMDLLEKAW